MKLWHIATLAALAGGLMAFAPSLPIVSTPPAAAAPDDGGEVYQKLLKEKGDAVVSIKYILKEQDEESEEEVQGVIVDESGLVLTSNFYMGGFPESLKQIYGRGNRRPLEIKVMISGDQEGVDATLVARDSELDLAWLQITNKDGKKFSFVDISKPTEARVGDRVLTLERLTKANDHAHIIRESRVRSLITKPRKLAVTGDELGGSIGMPVFNAKGEYVGVSSLQFPSKEEIQAEQTSQFAQFRRIPRAMVLPGEDVLKATNAAREQAKSGKPVDEEPKLDQPPPGVAKPDNAPKDEKKDDKPADPK